MGRTVEDGLLRVHDRPVEDSSAGRDPVAPVPTSMFAELLPGAAMVTLTGSPRTDADTLCAAANGGVVVVDAVSDADLRTLAAALVAAGPSAIPAGSAGLAAAMATAWAEASNTLAEPEPLPSPQGHRIVVLVSSLHDVARTQTEHLRSSLDPADLRILQPDAALLNEPDRVSAWVDAGALVLLGGDGARAVLDSTGAQSLRITGAVEEGIPLGVVEDGTTAGKIVVTKAGGFGPVSALLHIVNELNTTLTHSLEASS